MNKSGKYVVDGKEYSSSDIESLTETAAQALEQLPASQLDVMYIRNRLHSLNNIIQNITGELSIEIGTTNDLFKEFVAKIEKQNTDIRDLIPDIADLTTHKIVNGKFDKIEIMFSNINNEFKKIDSEFKAINSEFKSINTSLSSNAERMDFVLSKTIYGWFTNSMRSNSIKATIKMFLIVSMLLFVLFKIFDVPVLDPIWSLIRNILELIN